MDIGTISSRYAKALFSLAKDKEQESRVYDDMKMLANRRIINANGLVNTPKNSTNGMIGKGSFK